MGYSSNDQSFVEVAKAYILYRERRRIIRDEKASIGVKDDLKLSINAIKVLEARYLLKDEEGKIIETPRQMFRRVAGCRRFFRSTHAESRSRRGILVIVAETIPLSDRQFR